MSDTPSGAVQPTYAAYQAFVKAVIAARDVCPVCSYLWRECECGVITEASCAHSFVFSEDCYPPIITCGECGADLSPKPT